ncbi:MAG: carbonic anhydrase [Cyanobacteria bacterium SZAS LIN-2]|nr:carbonic anhydrase [Cyanobacteria bacterium SZAS LIN-3]MBS1997124.1 carbonic anhydrase [Cyanobacteria bacterium SZAS LIN-2]
MRKLIHGLHHFKNEVFASKRELFERLVQGQQPDALFITCADSRILPHLITQADPGDLFVLRNLGNIVPAYGADMEGAAASTIEFAVKALGVKDIIVCGHSHCGAMMAMLDGASLTDMPLVKKWLVHADATRAIIRENYAHLTDEHLLNVAIQENVLSQLESLKTHPVVAAAIGRGELALRGWVYKMETGEVFAYDAEEGQFLPFAEVQSVSRLPSLSATHVA